MRITQTIVRGLRGEAIDGHGAVTWESLRDYLQKNFAGGQHTVRASGDIVFIPPQLVEAKAESAVVPPPVEEVREQQERRIFRDDATDLGFIVHIHGPWGSGNTSVLSFLRNYLRGRRWVTIEFNAWRHQRMRPPWWMLIHAI